MHSNLTADGLSVTSMPNIATYCMLHVRSKVRWLRSSCLPVQAPIYLYTLMAIMHRNVAVMCEVDDVNDDTHTLLRVHNLMHNV